MSDDPLELTSWDVYHLYTDGYPDQAQRIARYLRTKRSADASVSSSVNEWIRCPHCGSADAEFDRSGGETATFSCLRCSETRTISR